MFGVYAPGQAVANLTYFGLFALQHRGQESAGIAVSDGERITVVKDMGLVTQVFDASRLAPLEGHLAIVVVLAGALVDIAVAWLDPRIRRPRAST